MFEPSNFYIDDGLESVGTSLVDISDETPEETSYRRLAEESWRKYLNLRRRANRRVPQSTFFELQPHGRGVRPAAMSGPNRPAVPLPMGNLAQSGHSVDANPLHPPADPPRLDQPTNDTNREGFTDVPPAQTDGLLGEAAGGVSRQPNPTVRHSPNIINVRGQDRTQELLRVIEEGPRNGVPTTEGNRSIRETVNQSFQSARQAVGDTLRQCASPFRHLNGASNTAAVRPRQHAEPAGHLQASTSGGARASVHFSRAQLEIQPNESARQDSRGAIPRPTPRRPTGVDLSERDIASLSIRRGLGQPPSGQDPRNQPPVQQPIS